MICGILVFILLGYILSELSKNIWSPAEQVEKLQYNMFRLSNFTLLFSTCISTDRKTYTSSYIIESINFLKK